MFDWFANFYLGIWQLDLFLYPLSAGVIYALLKMIFDYVRCRR